MDFLLVVCLKPMIVDAANHDNGQNAQNNGIDGCEKFDVMHHSLLLLHVLYQVPSSHQVQTNITTNALWMQKHAIRQNAAAFADE
jgi:hypothetical protein